jgi:hypothetical protein
MRIDANTMLGLVRAGTLPGYEGKSFDTQYYRSSSARHASFPLLGDTQHFGDGLLSLLLPLLGAVKSRHGGSRREWRLVGCQRTVPGGGACGGSDLSA